MELFDLLRLFGPLAVAVLLVWAFDRGTRSRGLMPPGLVPPGLASPPPPTVASTREATSLAPSSSAVLARADGDGDDRDDTTVIDRPPRPALYGSTSIRRFVAYSSLTIVFWFAITQSLSAFGTDLTLDLENLHPLQLFATHGFLVLGIVIWYLAGFMGFQHLEGAGFSRQLGLRTRTWLPEIGIGMAGGLVGWLVVVLVNLAAASFLMAIGAESLLPQDVPEIVTYLAGLSLGLRMLVSLSAGVVEELFFRGLLQPRIGILASTAMFGLAHLSYDQPWMLIGVTLLSLIFALLVRWRQSLLAAMVAHTVFDALQLAIIIPAALGL